MFSGERDDQISGVCVRCILPYRKYLQLILWSEIRIYPINFTTTFLLLQSALSSFPLKSFLPCRHNLWHSHCSTTKTTNERKKKTKENFFWKFITEKISSNKMNFRTFLKGLIPSCSVSSVWNQRFFSCCTSFLFFMLGSERTYAFLITVMKTILKQREKCYEKNALQIHDFYSNNNNNNSNAET